MISVEAENVEKLGLALAFFSKEAMARAVAESLNRPAAQVHKAAIDNVRRKLTVRTDFTLKSIVNDWRARGNIPGKMVARVGSKSKYLPAHDGGATIDAKERRVPVPVLSSRGGSVDKAILQKYRMNVFGQFAKNPRFFAGKPKGNRFKLVGIYERRGKSLLLLRHLEAQKVEIPKTSWFSDAVEKYGTSAVVQEVFREAATDEIAKIKGRFGL